MIVIIVGAPGIGKTTLLEKLGERLGCPYLELSWMPEFREKNGQPIPYEEDEQVAIENLVLIAQNYRRHGHRIVLLSDFRIESLPAVTRLIPPGERLILTLVMTDSAELKRRVLNETRPSGYRNWKYALALNERLRSMPLDHEEKIDITGLSIEETIARLEQAIANHLTRNCRRR